MPEKYSDAELRRLWLQFADAPNAAERLAGFAVCDISTAKEMIRQFQNDSAAARRAAEADRKRLAANNTTAKKKPSGRQKKPGKENPVIAEDVIASLPPSDLLASLINDVHGFSEIKCEGRTRTRAVVIEQFGEVFRLKRTTFRYFRSLEEAIEAAQIEHIRLREF